MFGAEISANSAFLVQKVQAVAQKSYGFSFAVIDPRYALRFELVSTSGAFSVLNLPLRWKVCIFCEASYAVI